MTMTLTKRNIYILITLNGIFALTFTVMRFILMLEYYDVNEGLYSNDAYGVTAFNIGLLIACLIIGGLGIMQKPTEEYKKLLPSGNGVVFTGALCGFMFLSSLIIQAVYFLPNVIKNDTIGEKILFILALLLTVPSALYYFWCASTTKMQRINYQLLSFCPILWAVLFVIYMYFDDGLVMNSPERAIIQLAFIMSMLYMTSEARFHVGAAKPRLHIAVSLICMLVICVACVPDFLLSAFWMLPFTANTVYSALLIAVAAYIASRLPSLAEKTY